MRVNTPSEQRNLFHSAAGFHVADHAKRARQDEMAPARTHVFTNDAISLQGRLTLIRFWQAERLLSDEAECELRTYRRNARDQRFAKKALDVVLLRVAHAAVHHDGGLACPKA